MLECSDTNCVICPSDDKQEIKHRELTSHMILSHIPILLPCIWWIFGYNIGTHVSHSIDKVMAAVLTSSILISSIYHYYYECVLCSIETRALQLNTAVLNLYMWYRGVPYIYIFAGWGMLIILSLLIDRFDKSDKLTYERNHPYCHYLAGIYVTYCVYLIQHTYVALDEPIIGSSASDCEVIS